jgi:hypothetical protein
MVMGQATYEEVVKLADQLSPDEQHALIEHLQKHRQRPRLSWDAWDALLASVRVSAGPGPLFSDRREDWY